VSGKTGKMRQGCSDNEPADSQPLRLKGNSFILFFVHNQTFTCHNLASAGVHDLKLRNFADPEGLYSALPSIVFEETIVNVPDICDRNGLLIHPRDYMSKLEHSSKVAIEVILRL
jgi:hypothetical protein